MPVQLLLIVRVLLGLCAVANHFFADHVGHFSSLESILDSFFISESNFNSESESDLELETNLELGV